jgi:hypothetical protein
VSNSFAGLQRWFWCHVGFQGVAGRQDGNAGDVMSDGDAEKPGGLAHGGGRIN